MKKDFTRDYATEMFRLYAAAGRPTYEQAREEIYQAELNLYSGGDPSSSVSRAEAAVEDATPYLLDLHAVDRTIAILHKGQRQHIVQAVEAVYFVQPNLPLRRGEISNRVRRFAACCPSDERTVYHWLREARLLCAAIRGLRIADIDADRYSIEL